VSARSAAGYIYMSPTRNFRDPSYLICSHEACLHGVRVHDAELFPYHHPAAPLLTLPDLGGIRDANRENVTERRGSQWDTQVLQPTTADHEAAKTQTKRRTHAQDKNGDGQNQFSGPGGHSVRNGKKPNKNDEKPTKKKDKKRQKKVSKKKEMTQEERNAAKGGRVVERGRCALNRLLRRKRRWCCLRRYIDCCNWT